MEAKMSDTDTDFVRVHWLRLQMLEQFMAVCVAMRHDDPNVKEVGKALDKAIERWIKAGRP